MLVSLTSAGKLPWSDGMTSDAQCLKAKEDCDFTALCKQLHCEEVRDLEFFSAYQVFVPLLMTLF